MTKLLDLLYRFRWPIVVLAALAFTVWFVVNAFGDQLSIPMEMREQVNKGLQGVSAFVLTAVSGLIARIAKQDKDKDGVPDILDDKDDREVAKVEVTVNGRVLELDRIISRRALLIAAEMPDADTVTWRDPQAGTSGSLTGETAMVLEPGMVINISKTTSA